MSDGPTHLAARTENPPTKNQLETPQLTSPNSSQRPKHTEEAAPNSGPRHRPSQQQQQQQHHRRRRRRRPQPLIPDTDRQNGCRRQGPQRQDQEQSCGQLPVLDPYVDYSLSFGLMPSVYSQAGCPWFPWQKSPKARLSDELFFCHSLHLESHHTHSLHTLSSPQHMSINDHEVWNGTLEVKPLTTFTALISAKFPLLANKHIPLAIHGPPLFVTFTHMGAVTSHPTASTNRPRCYPACEMRARQLCVTAG